MNRLLFVLFLPIVAFGQTPLPNAHAHNDYEHLHPLKDALSYGFMSVEADIHLINGELYVIHDRPSDLQGVPTLKEAYLIPLWERTQQGQIPVFEGVERPFLLMVDIKTEAQASYHVLKAQLLEFEAMLSQRTADTLQPGQVLIFLSGNRPMEMVKDESHALVGLDGRPTDLGQYKASVMPVISDSYRNHFTWNGEGKIPPQELEWLTQFVDQAHTEGKLVRFWAIPDQENVWDTFKSAGVDLINTDRLGELAAFLNKTQGDQ